MIIAVLVLASLLDLALAALLIGVSGFIFGAGPESTHGGTLLLVGYSAFVVACVVLPGAGFFAQSAWKGGHRHAAGVVAAGGCVGRIGIAAALLMDSGLDTLKQKAPAIAAGAFACCLAAPDQRE